MVKWVILEKECDLGLVLGIKPFSNANGDTKGLKFVSLVPKPLPREEEKGLVTIRYPPDLVTAIWHVK